MISDKIAFLRSQHGMTQTELARHCGVSLSTVKNWETGLTEPHLVHIRAICSALKVNADFLLDISESPVVNLDGLEDADIAVIKALVQHLLNKNEHSQQRKGLKRLCASSPTDCLSPRSDGFPPRSAFAFCAAKPIAALQPPVLP